MQTIIKLFRLQMDDRSDIFRTDDKKKMFLGILKYLFIILVMTVVFTVAMMLISAFGFKVNKELLAIVLLFSQTISMFFALGTILRDMFFSRENELLMVLPATPDELFISKLAVIYVQEFLMNTVMLFPLTFAVGFSARAGFVYFLATLLFLLILPIIPLAVATLLAIPTSYIIKLLKKNTVVSLIIIIIAVGAAVFGYCTLIDRVMKGFDLMRKQIEIVIAVNGFIAKFGGAIPFYAEIAEMAFDFGKWYYLPMLIGVCAALLFIGAMIIKPFFFKTAMTNLETESEPGKKSRRFIVESPLKSMLRKELTEIFRSPDYFFEYYLFTFLMPVFVLCYDKLMVHIVVSKAGESMVAGAHILIVAVFAMLSNVSAANAITKEGGNYYISKIVPVDYYTQIFAKYLLNLILTGVALAVTAVVSCFSQPLWQVALGTVAVFFASAGHIALGIDMDIKSPTLDWYSDEEISACNKNIARSIVWGLIIAVLMGAVIVLTASVKTTWVPWVILVLFGALFCAHRVIFLILRINCAYDNIEI